LATPGVEPARSPYLHCIALRRKEKNMSGSGDPTRPIFLPDPKHFSFEYEKKLVRFFTQYSREFKKRF